MIISHPWRNVTRTIPTPNISYPDFSHLNISHHGYFSPGTFPFWDISHSGHFPPRTFPTFDISHHEHFPPGTFPTGTFPTRKFPTGAFPIPEICPAFQLQMAINSHEQHDTNLDPHDTSVLENCRGLSSSMHSGLGKLYTEKNLSFRDIL